MVGFIWGGNTGKSYADLKREKEMAEMLLAQSANTPRNIGEGLTAIGNALAGRVLDRRASKALEKNAARERDIVAALYGGNAPAAAPAAAAAPVPDGASASMTPVAGAFKGGTPPPSGGKTGANIEAAYRQLIGMGYPPHIAAGLTGNLMQESLRKGDINPAAVGDGGAAYGVGQWNGPRKEAYLKFAAEAGADPADLATQIKFLDFEMNGPESAARAALMKAKTAEEAAMIASTAYWRPGVPMMNNRIRYANDVFSRYGAEGGGAPAAPASPPGGAPVAPPAAPDNSARIAQLIAAATDPTMSPETRQIVGALLSAEMARNAPPKPMTAAEAARLELDRRRFGADRADADRNYALARDKMEADAGDPPAVKEVTFEDGSTGLVQWDRGKREWVPINAPGGSGVPKAPGKMTEVERRWALFGQLQKDTAPILSKIETIWDPANISDAAAKTLPIGSSFFTSEEGQIYRSAAAQWAEGALRIATGAAATQPEIDRVVATYFATAGDTPNTIAFKRSMREGYERAINAGLGKTIEGTLTLPDDFAKRFAADNPTSAAPANPMGAAGATAAAAGAAFSEAPVPEIPAALAADPEVVRLWPTMSPEMRKKFMDYAARIGDGGQ